MTGDVTGKILTVEGPIDPEDLGVTLPHEHMFMDPVEGRFNPPSSAVDRARSDEPISLENLDWIRRNPLRHKENMVLDSYDEALEEARTFHRFGGDTIVDVTPKHIGGDPERVRSVGRETGVQIVHGTAHYHVETLPDFVYDLQGEEIEEEFVDDIRNGIDDTNIKAGVIGEIGLKDHIYEVEEKILRAAARAAVRTGAPLTVHPPGASPKSRKDGSYFSSKWGHDILDIVEEEGLSPERTVICHMDRNWFEDLEAQKELCERGAFVEYDVWGTQFVRTQQEVGYASDKQRIEWVSELIDAGYQEHLLFSHDIFCRAQRRRYGGHGQVHIIKNVVPMLKWHGYGQEVINDIIKRNPKRWLTFDEPEE